MYSAVFRVYVHVVSEQKKTGRLYLLRLLSNIMFTCLQVCIYNCVPVRDLAAVLWQSSGLQSAGKS